MDSADGSAVVEGKRAIRQYISALTFLFTFFCIYIYIYIFFVILYINNITYLECLTYKLFNLNVIYLHYLILVLFTVK